MRLPKDLLPFVDGDWISVSIFIASVTNTGCPTSTWSPSFTITSTMKVAVATGGLLPSTAGEALGPAAWIANIQISVSSAAAVKPTALVCGLLGIDNLGLGLQ